MNVAVLVDQAEHVGIRLHLDGARLVADAPLGAQADAILAQLHEHRLAVAAWLRRPLDPMEAGCPQPQNLRRFEALVRLSRQRGGP